LSTKGCNECETHDFFYVTSLRFLDTHTHTHTHTHKHMPIHTHIRTHIHTYIHTHIHPPTHTNKHTHIHTRIYTRIYTRTYTQIHTQNDRRPLLPAKDLVLLTYPIFSLLKLAIFFWGEVNLLRRKTMNKMSVFSFTNNLSVRVIGFRETECHGRQVKWGVCLAEDQKQSSAETEHPIRLDANFKNRHTLL